MAAILSADEGRTRAIARLRKLSVRYEKKGNHERATVLRQRVAVLVAGAHRCEHCSDTGLDPNSDIGNDCWCVHPGGVNYK